MGRRCLVCLWCPDSLRKPSSLSREGSRSGCSVLSQAKGGPGSSTLLLRLYLLLLTLPHREIVFKRFLLTLSQKMGTNRRNPVSWRGGALCGYWVRALASDPSGPPLQTLSPGRVWPCPRARFLSARGGVLTAHSPVHTCVPSRERQKVRRSHLSSLKAKNIET